MEKKLLKRLTALKKAFVAKKTFDMRRLSNDTAEEAALSGDRNLAELSVVTYALYKLSTKEHIVKNPHWEAVKKKIAETLEQSAGALLKGDIGSFKKKLSSISQEATNLDRAVGFYAMKTFEKARVKQASRAYAIGLSMGRAAELMGADTKQLQSYIGGTKIHEGEPIEKGIGERLKALKGILKK